MTAMLDDTAADLRRANAEFQRQLGERTAERQREMFKDDLCKRRTGKACLDDGPTPICSADEAELDSIGAPTSPRLPLCLADEAGAAHTVAGNPGHPGDIE